MQVLSENRISSDLKFEVNHEQAHIVFVITPGNHKSLGDNSLLRYSPLRITDTHSKIPNLFLDEKRDISLDESQDNVLRSVLRLSISSLSESSDIASGKWALLRGTATGNVIGFNFENEVADTSKEQSSVISAQILAQEVHLLSLQDNLNDVDNERDEERAVDLLFEFFVHNIADQKYKVVDDGLRCLSPKEMTNACALTVLHLTYRVKDKLKFRKSFYAEAYEIVETRSGKEIASDLFDKLA